MIERLYLADPYLARFDADVLAERRLGERTAVVLSRTAFYPEGGGQPADHGTLGPARVVDVQEVEGEILHSVEGAVPAGRVTGVLDWARRFDHMQQHHGQHLLSAAFEAALGAHTVSFHLGEETCTIDLDVSADRLGPATLVEIERTASELVWRDLAVEVRELGPEELARLALRKEPTKGSRVVVVRDPLVQDERGGLRASAPGQADDAGSERRGPPGAPRPAGLPGLPGLIDASPCGGTHPRRTGEVGAIAVLRAQKWGAGARVEFACGGRVLGLLRCASERLGAVASALRCAPHEAPGAAARLAAESLGRKKDLDRFALTLARAEAVRLAARAGAIAEELEVPAGDAASYLRAVGQALAAEGRLALLGARGDGRALLCFARPKGAGPDLGALLREAVAVLDGKGGGAPDLAQGGGPRAEKLGEAIALARGRVVAG
jgi:alanyl-tRNA synthetase